MCGRPTPLTFRLGPLCARAASPVQQLLAPGVGRTAADVANAAPPARPPHSSPSADDPIIGPSRYAESLASAEGATSSRCPRSFLSQYAAAEETSAAASAPSSPEDQPDEPVWRAVQRERERSRERARKRRAAATAATKAAAAAAGRDKQTEAPMDDVDGAGAASDRHDQKKPCPFMRRAGGCRLGKNCFYTHDCPVPGQGAGAGRNRTRRGATTRQRKRRG